MEMARLEQELHVSQSTTDPGGGGQEHSPRIWEIKYIHLTLNNVSSAVQHNGRLHRAQVCSSMFQKD